MITSKQAIQSKHFKLLQGDAIEQMKRLRTNFVHSIVTDPPYGLNFMGKKWDHGVPGVAFWEEALRVIRPGGYMLAFGGTRTDHRLACAIEDAGWEIRDKIMWVYGSGFPKSLSVSKAIDATMLEGNSGTRNLRKTEQATGGESYKLKGRNNGILGEEREYDRKEWEPVTQEAQQWDGWGTALKPAYEPIIVARKPSSHTVANTTRIWGTGGLNIDGCKIGDEVRTNPCANNKPGGNSLNMSVTGMPIAEDRDTKGRWPANLIHDGSDEATAGMGEAARYFYCPKANKKDRDEGLDDFEGKESKHAYGNGMNSATKIRTKKQATDGIFRELRKNTHPTVKPTDLMRYLTRLVTPPSGIVLDPFMGSGSTGKAAIREGFRFIGIDNDPESVELALGRVSHAWRKKNR